ncbi:hypothetical protein [Thiomicrorhabdus sp. Milos-T2]|uniref:hypothetical protein n=1 Tax=Thiomicrorhabdus sp. Milos-T2 TaxID=90814 RepID=UPI000493D9BF|nr:hypothetical protein [Thiomicrorhabdus sp. Milos-T2]
MMNFKITELTFDQVALSELSEKHPIWKGIELKSSYKGLEPNDLFDMMENKVIDDSWIDWLLISNPIVVTKRLQRKSQQALGVDAEEVKPGYYLIMGYTNWFYATSYLGYKYGDKILSSYKVPVLVLPLSQISSKTKDAIISNELFFQSVLQKPKNYYRYMQEYLDKEVGSVSQFIKTSQDLAKFAGVSKSNLVKRNNSAKAKSQLGADELTIEGDADANG